MKILKSLWRAQSLKSASPTVENLPRKANWGWNTGQYRGERRAAGMGVPAAFSPRSPDFSTEASGVRNDATGLPTGRPGSVRDETVKVWLVDDNNDIREQLARLLVNVGGFECVGSFASARQAIEALETHAAPDVILLDVEMPGLRGPDAVLPLRKGAPGTEIIILTTFWNSHDEKAALTAGASNFLLKSESVDKIAASICEALGRSSGCLPARDD
jgi:CheY-like chemotaxis protein